ncbi:MAG: hypothetical protein QOI11_1374 [Candidatus Eremiobacteraeota bacterium]|nr:hypothetical protein [Candidatus Eremiobacteraeota bacterium]
MDVPMRLKPSPLVPGLWQTDDFRPRGAATYAFVVGASRYVNFEPPSPESLGMGSLAVSALTAYRFFRWLGTMYRTADEPAPPVQCRLFLSPTDDEQDLFDGGAPEKIVVGDAPGSTARPPTLIGLMQGLQAWFNELVLVTGEQAERSRLVFFYSGHGLEIDPGRQLLVPCDYRYTEAEQNNFISTENVRDALRKLAIWNQFFFLDACRSDIAAMHELASASGLPVLPVSRNRNQRNSAPVLYASASGSETYQPPLARALDDLGSVTFLGKAILSALELSSAVEPPFAPVVSGEPPIGTITYKPLSTHVNDVLTAELSAWKIRMLGAPVVVDGLRGDPAFCAVSVPPQGVDADAVRGIAGFVSRLQERTAEYLGDSVFRAARSVGFERPRVTGEAPPPAPRELRSVGGVAPDEPTESATRRLELGSLGPFLLDAAVFRWCDGEWLPVQTSGARAYEVLDLEFEPEAGRLRAHLRFSEGAWYFLQAQQPDRPAYAFMLPPGSPGEGEPVFAIDLVCDRGGIVIEAQALLSARNTGPLARAAELYAASLPPGAAPPLPAGVPADAPLARTIVAMLAFRGDRLAELGETWLDDLALSGPYSDAAVFRLRALVDESDPFDARATLPYVDALARNGSPFTTEGFGQIVRLFEMLFEPGADGEPPLLDARDASMLPPTWQRFHERVAGIARSFRGSGLLASFASTAEQMQLIRGSIA